MICPFKQIWELLLRKKITVTAEYLPSLLNRYADIESRLKADPSEWKLSVPKTLYNIGKAINRLLSFQGVSSASNKCSPEVRSAQCCNQCILNDLKEGVF